MQLQRTVSLCVLNMPDGRRKKRQRRAAALEDPYETDVKSETETPAPTPAPVKKEPQLSIKCLFAAMRDASASASASCATIATAAPAAPAAPTAAAPTAAAASSASQSSATTTVAQPALAAMAAGKYEPAVSHVYTTGNVAAPPPPTVGAALAAAPKPPAFVRRFTDDELATKTLTKGELDAFGHKIRHVVPDEVKDLWTNEFAKLKRTDLKRKEFVAECLAVGRTMGAWTSPYFTHMLRIAKTDTSGREGGLITFHQLVDKEGPDSAMLIATHRRLHMEPNPKTSGLPGVLFPFDQLFAYDQAVWSNLTSNTESLTAKSTSDGTVAAAEMMHDAMQIMQRLPDAETRMPVVVAADPAAANVAANAAAESAAVAAESAAVAKHNKLCVDTIAVLKKNHGEWDRTKMNWNGQVTKADSNTNAKDTKVVNDLRELLSEGVAIDLVLTGHLNTWIASGNLAVAEIDEIREKFDALGKLMKSGQKIVSVVGVLLKL